MRKATIERDIFGCVFRRFFPTAAAASAFLVLLMLYSQANHALYTRLLSIWGVHAFSFPFLDTDMVLSALRCRRLGIDVFVTNPCDALQRLYDYSPLWLAAAVLPVTTAWTVPVGLAVDVAFLSTLPLLPAGRGWKETLAIAAGAISTAVMFAAERGNNEFVIFALAACAASLALRRRGVRLLGYAVAMLAGLLKYFPLALLALTLRERPKVFLVAAASASGLLAIFVLVERADLFRAIALIPTGSYFGDMFGAATLPGGIVQLLDLPRPIAPCIEVALLTTMLVRGIKTGSSTALRSDIGSLMEIERVFLFAGALLVLGCFLAARNIGYRALELLLVLPSITALSRVAGRPAPYIIGVGIILLLLWAEGWRTWIENIFVSAALPARSAVFFGAWLVREAAWWWIATLLAGLLTGLTRSSETGRAAIGVWTHWKDVRARG